MNILGLNLGYMSSASIFKNGEIISCVSEERFSRRKNDESYPKNAIEYCLAHANIQSGSDVDAVAIGSVSHDLWHRLAHYYSKFSIADRIAEQHNYWKPVLIDGTSVHWEDLYADRMDYDQYPGNWKRLTSNLSKGQSNGKKDQQIIRDYLVSIISTHTKIPANRFHFVDHHLAHASYAYYASPYRQGKTLVITLDAFGDGNSATISLGENGSLTRLKAISHNDFQLARIYRYVTLLMGMKPDEHEYKVMGLAPYAKYDTYKKAYSVFKDIVYVDGIDFKIKNKPKDLYHYFRDALEGVRFDGIAGGLQRYAEEIIVQWVENVINHYGVRRIVLAGGVVMNIKAIQKVSELSVVEEMFVPPSPGDESLGMGAAYYCASELRSGVIKPLRNAYLGTDIDINEENNLIEKIAASSTEYKITRGVSPSLVAKNLAAGRVIGRCAGRMEFGARSLGNRSIIADARSEKMIRIINEKIKNRDFWMPFAPAILKEYAENYIVNPKSLLAPFMTIAFNTHELAHKHFPAGIHPIDFTARPQLVDVKDNPEFYQLIADFKDLTGVAAVLNTSFNLHGEPIVRSAEDAYRVFELTDIDDLWVGKTLISKV